MQQHLITQFLVPAGIAVSCLLPVTLTHADDHHGRRQDLVQAVLPVTHGVAAGDVRAHSAVIWSRSNARGWMHVRVTAPQDDHARQAVTPVTAERDFTGKVYVDGLRPDTDYTYTVWFSRERDDHPRGSKGQHGRFHTAPRAERAAAVSFAWGGDLAGQNVCRDAQAGFPIFDTLNAMPLDFFIGLGDMIYADGTCKAEGLYGNAQIAGDYSQSADMANYWAHWKYNRGDNGYRRLLASMPYYAIWDDHEVVNDFGPLSDTRSTPPYTAGQHLLPLGLRAFLDYNPVAEPRNRPKRLYRTLRWGKHFELFVLDTRQYRDANSENDDATLKKTMLGREQLTWLKARLKASDATWKMIVSSVPISIPTGYPAENAATAGPTSTSRPVSSRSCWTSSVSCATKASTTACGSPPTCTSPRSSATRPSPTRRTSRCMNSSPGRSTPGSFPIATTIKGWAPNACFSTDRRTACRTMPRPGSG